MENQDLLKHKKKKAKKEKKSKKNNNDQENQVIVVDDNDNDIMAVHVSPILEKRSGGKKRKKTNTEENERLNENDELEIRSNDSNSNNGNGDKLVQSNSKKRLKKEKKSKKEKKKKESKKKKHKSDKTTKLTPHDITATPNQDDLNMVGGRIVSFSASIINDTDVTTADTATVTAATDNSSAIATDDSKIVEVHASSKHDDDHENIHTPTPASTDGCTLLLFYQYIEPMLDEEGFQQLFDHVQTTGEQYSISGRARVAYEGLNCTLTGSYQNVRLWCKSLRAFGQQYFKETEFKLTDHLPMGQAFNKKLHAFKVDEIVNYGLAGERAPAIQMSGVHLEPKDYHEKMREDNTVIIDVRNHYEAAIGKFKPPSTGAKYIDPMMRKSTEFPVWLDKPETKEMLKGKQVLMYCTGGVRCERASALLRTKIENEEDTKALGIQGVYQLQGGIDKYFRDFPEGGWWKGKNYVFGKMMMMALILYFIEFYGSKR